MLASGGAVAHANQTLKTKLTKLIAETDMSHKMTRLSPYEIITGCPLKIINTPFPQNRLTLTKLDADSFKIVLCI